MIRASIQVPQPELREPYPYRLTVSAPEQFCARAVLADGDSGQSCVLSAGNALTALYVLGRRLQADRAQGLPAEEQGWCRHEDLARAVWGRDWRDRIENHLYVLLHRLRAKLGQAGLDPRCIETGHGATRLLLREVELP